MFWSPDSRSLAFFAERQVEAHRPARRRCGADLRRSSGTSSHGTWGADGVILMGQRQWNVDLTQSRPRVALPGPDSDGNQSKGEVRVHWPWFLPDGKRFLYTARLDDGEGELRLAQLRLDDREGNARSVQLEEGTRTVMRASSNAQWVDPDVVVFAREGVLMGQRVDVEAARPFGEPFSMAERVEYFFTSSRAMFSASRTGTVAYPLRPGHQTAGVGRPEWQRGRDVSASLRLPAPVCAVVSVTAAQLLVSRRRAGLGTYDIWRMDLVRADARNGSRRTAAANSALSGSTMERAIALCRRQRWFAAAPVPKRPCHRREKQQVLPPGSQQLAIDVFPDGRAVAYVGALTVRTVQALFQLL